MPSASASRLLLGLAVAAGGLVACGVPLTSVQQGLEAAGVASTAYTHTTTDEAVALEASGSGLTLTHVFRGDRGWVVERCRGSGAASTSIAAYFCGAEGPLVHRWNAFLYGTAADPVERLGILDLEFAGGDVRGGLWLVAIGEPDLPIGAVRWTALTSEGRVIASGEGVPGA